MMIRRLIRVMNSDDVAVLVAAARRLPVLKVTLAPESVTPEQMRILVRAGAIVAGRRADFICLDRDMALVGVWRHGRASDLG